MSKEDNLFENANFENQQKRGHYFIASAFVSTENAEYKNTIQESCKYVSAAKYVEIVLTCSKFDRLESISCVTAKLSLSLCLIIIIIINE